MSILLSCSGNDIEGLEEGVGSLFMRSLNIFQNVQSALRSLSFNGRDSEPAIHGAVNSRKLFAEGSLSFNGRESEPIHLETKVVNRNPITKGVKTSQPKTQKISRFSPLSNMSTDSQINEVDNSSSGDNLPSTVKKTARFAHIKKRSDEDVVIEDDSPKHEAAVKLQKVYRSFRTRRQLADCAVLIEQHWWKLLDFALLKRTSVSFFDIDKEESAVSKWSRAKSRAAKVGKGLSKNEKAQKLALQHWLEAIDPRHRYGHNLHFYYDSWLQCESNQPFFYWLDVGEGKEVNLLEQCPRPKLQQQCIKYLGPKEREAYEVIIEDGKFMYKNNREILHTNEGDKNDKWIFVLSTSRTLYVGQKMKGKFQHSSFLAGGATSAAGRLVAENGILKSVCPHSGHYRPTQENLEDFLSFLEENNVDVSAVQKSSIEEDEELDRLISISSQANLSDNNLVIDSEIDLQTETSTEITGTDTTLDRAPTGGIDNLDNSELVERHEEKSVQVKKLKLKFLEIPSLDIETPSSGITDDNPTNRSFSEEDEEAFVPQEKILQRINSKKALKSYQLGKQLTCKWTTGAGPRIGCVRDYPSELQFLTLEEVHLSPRAAGPSRFFSANSPLKRQDATTPKEPQRYKY